VLGLRRGRRRGRLRRCRGLLGVPPEQELVQRRLAEVQKLVLRRGRQRRLRNQGLAFPKRSKLLLLGKEEKPTIVTT
jgi:hypothetical protein